MADRNPALAFLVSLGNPVPRCATRQAIYDLLAK
jgi:hypothetical protein